MLAVNNQAARELIIKPIPTNRAKSNMSASNRRRMLYGVHRKRRM